jgi:anti-anti-sigma factor
MNTDTGVHFLQDGDRLILFVFGRITANEAYALYHQLHVWLAEHTAGTVFVDMDHTTYIDSTTVGTLIKLHKQQRSGPGGFYLCNLSPQVRDVIEKTKLDRYFSIIENADLHQLEQRALEQMPVTGTGDLSAAFVLDAHNDICEVVPEMKPQFAGLIDILEQQLNQ